MRLCRYILIVLLFQCTSLNGASNTNPTGRTTFTQKLESQLRKDAFRFLARKKQEPVRVERIKSTITRLQAEIHSNSPHKEMAKLQLQKISAYLEREIDTAQQEKLSLLYQIDALKTKKIQNEVEGRISENDAVILRRYIDLYALRIAFLNQKIRVREKFLPTIFLETTSTHPPEHIWPAFAAFIFMSVLLASIRHWTAP